MIKDDSKKPEGLFSSFGVGLSQAHPAAQGIPPPPPGPNTPYPLAGLDQFFSRPVVRGLYYNGKALKLDGYKFVGCRFDNCTLVVESPNFELMDCVVDQSTAIQYGVEPIKIIRLFNSRNEWIYANLPAFAPIRNPDGTITIKGGY